MAPAKAIEPVPLPDELQEVFTASDTDIEGYGAVFLSRITGYDFDGDDTLLQTQYRRIRILDDNGVTITPKGRLLLRSIAMVFDRYIDQDENDNRFSKAI